MTLSQIKEVFKPKCTCIPNIEHEVRNEKHRIVSFWQVLQDIYRLKAKQISHWSLAFLSITYLP